MKSVDAAILRESFSAFVLSAFRQTHGQRLGSQPYVQHLCNEISKFIDGKTTRLLINLPPQHLKTFVGSIALPAYLLGKNPRLRIILTAYNDTLAEDLCEKIREMMKSAWYKQVFATRIKGGHSRTNDFATEENGGVYAVSATGSVTGRAADVVIYDDPHEISDWNNERKLTLVRDNFNTLLSRLSNKVTGRIIVVAHRLSTRDLSSALLEETGWTYVRLPLVAVETQEYDLGNATWTRRKGDILQPEAYPKAEIERLLRTQLAPPFGHFFQQGFDSGFSQVVRPDDFQNFAPYQLPVGPVVLSIDPGFGTGLTASRTVIQAWKCLNEKFYLADQYCEPCDAEQFRRMFWKFVKRHNPSVALIEATANGPALYARIRNKARFDIRLITPRRASKAVRLNAHIEKIHAKQIFLPQCAPWRQAFIDEIAGYPSDFDDQLDAMTQYLDYMDTKPTIKPAPRRGVVARPTINYRLR
jgi:predicted phage terminase large subunit-like protein